MPKGISITRAHHKIDATDMVLGRLATRIATVLRGKNKVTYQPHIDAGDSITVVNASHIKITGQKMGQKVYYRHSGYPGGLKTEKLSALFVKDPGEVIRRAVKNMLPPTRLRNGMMKRLHIEK